MPYIPLTRRAAAVLACGLLLGTAALAQQPQRRGDQPPSPKVKISTDVGDIVVELNRERAPRTVENFLQYVRDKHYDGTIFHRVIDGFMIQGGGFTQDMKQKPTNDPILLESNNGLRNTPYTIAMARMAHPHSATSQFFINVADNKMLNAPKPDGYGYAVFGKVVQGQDVVDHIRAVPTRTLGMHQNVPVTPVTILSAEEIKPAASKAAAVTSTAPTGAAPTGATAAPAGEAAAAQQQ